jgi:N-acyl-D-amino-acid deacylase
MLLEAIAEAIHIGEETGAAVQISHLKAAGRLNWSKAAQALELIDQARDRGLDVSSDMYPYMASSTGLDILIPEWAHEGGPKVILERLVDPAERRRIKDDPHMERVSAMASWDKVLICRSPKTPEFEGRSIADLSDAAEAEVADWIMDALLETELEADILPFIMSEENVKMQMGHPALMIGSDGYALIAEGPLAKGVPHPRSYGTFPRILGRFVREEKVLSLEQAIHKMTGLPAERLRWNDRGLVKQDFQADLVVFDPETVADKATYTDPHQYAVGINYVIVNGVPVIHDGIHTGTRPGKLLN